MTTRVDECRQAVEVLQAELDAIRSRLAATEERAGAVRDELAAVGKMRRSALVNDDRTMLKKSAAAADEHAATAAELSELALALRERAAELTPALTTAKQDLKTAIQTDTEAQLQEAINRYHAALPELVAACTEILRLRLMLVGPSTSYAQLVGTVPEQLRRYRGESKPPETIFDRVLRTTALDRSVRFPNGN
jgi:predicted  nucleic acid-binding Zn-ribbon protein